MLTFRTWLLTEAKDTAQADASGKLHELAFHSLTDPDNPSGKYDHTEEYKKLFEVATKGMSSEATANFSRLVDERARHARETLHKSYDEKLGAGKWKVISSKRTPNGVTHNGELLSQKVEPADVVHHLEIQGHDGAHEVHCFASLKAYTKRTLTAAGGGTTTLSNGSPHSIIDHPDLGEHKAKLDGLISDYKRDLSKAANDHIKEEHAHHITHGPLVDEALEHIRKGLGRANRHSPELGQNHIEAMKAYSSALKDKNDPLHKTIDETLSRLTPVVDNAGKVSHNISEAPPDIEHLKKAITQAGVNIPGIGDHKDYSTLMAHIPQENLKDVKKKERAIINTNDRQNLIQPIKERMRTMNNPIASQSFRRTISRIPAIVARGRELKSAVREHLHESLSDLHKSDPKEFQRHLRSIMHVPESPHLQDGNFAVRLSTDWHNGAARSKVEDSAHPIFTADPAGYVISNMKGKGSPGYVQITHKDHPGASLIVRPKFTSESDPGQGMKALCELKVTKPKTPAAPKPPRKPKPPGEGRAEPVAHNPP